MKNIIMIFALLLSPVISYAENTHITKAMGLYKQKEINKAVTLLIENIRFEDITSLSSIEKLKYALILNQNILMYKDILNKSVTTQNIFLNTLVSDTGKDKSKLARLFLTETLILKKDLTAAEENLAAFKQENNSDNKIHSIINYYYSWVARVKNDKKAIDNLENQLAKDDVLGKLGFASLDVLTQGKSQVSSNEVMAASDHFIKNRNILSMRFANYAVRIFTHNGDLALASNVMQMLDQKLPSYTENITQFKQINFYEPSLIDSVTSFYIALSRHILEELKKDAKYHDMAVYYLSDIELMISNKKSAQLFKEDMLKLKRLPKGLSSILAIRQNAHGYLFGKTTRAFQAWEKAVNNAKNNPRMGAEAVLMCIYLSANCPTIVQTAQLKAENGRSKRFEALNTNVGRYFLYKEEYIKALRLLENALDRSKADGILMNEPILLINLAEIYRLDQRYSESLQIFFSLGQNFPIVRQIQDAVQGEYLFKQRSTGKSNVF